MSETLSEIIRLRLKQRVTPPPGNYVSMRYVAKQTGLAVSTISRFVDGKPIGSNALDKIAKFLEVE